MPSQTQKFGRYTLNELIARGGMGEVYLASLEGVAGFEKQCVIKKIRPDLASDDTFIERFLNEGRTLVALTHSNIVQIFDMGEVGGEYYLAMEYVSGADLRFLLRHIEPQTFIPIDTIIAIILDTLRGLAHAHMAKDKNGIPLGIVHRDISPSNILISQNGEVKLIDFGIAKARTIESCTGLVQGKFAYMSPEQARGDSLDARTDIFSLGIVLYEMLTSVRPFEGNSDLQCLEHIKFKNHTPVRQLRPDADDDIEAIISKALAKNRTERFQSADAFYDALDDYARSHGYKAGQREIAAYFKPMLMQEFMPMAQPGINDMLDAMLQAQAMNATMTRTQTITPKKLQSANDDSLAFAQTGSAVKPINDALPHNEASNLPSHQEKISRSQPSFHPIDAENQSVTHDTPQRTGSITNIKVLAEFPSSDLAIIEESDLFSEETRKQIQQRRLITRIKYTIVGAVIMLLLICSYFVYRNLKQQKQQSANELPSLTQAVGQPQPILPPPEALPPKSPDMVKKLTQGVPFVIQTVQPNATIYVVEGKYHSLKAKSVILEPGTDAEIAIQAPGFETCLLHVGFSHDNKRGFEDLKWQNCAATHSQYSLQTQQVECIVSLMPIRAAHKNDVENTNRNNSDKQNTKQPESIATDSDKSPLKSVQPERKTSEPKQAKHTRPKPGKPDLNPQPQEQALIKHTVKTSRAASAVIDGTKYDLPGEIEAGKDTKINVLPNVSGKTIAIPQTIIWNDASPADIAFCEVKIRIRESYAPGDPAPYQIADIAIDGKTIARQTDFASIVLPCGAHEAKAEIQAGNTLLQSKSQFNASPGSPLTVPMLLKP